MEMLSKLQQRKKHITLNETDDKGFTHCVNFRWAKARKRGFESKADNIWLNSLRTTCLTGTSSRIWKQHTEMFRELHIIYWIEWYDISVSKWIMKYQIKDKCYNITPAEYEYCQAYWNTYVLRKSQMIGLWKWKSLIYTFQPAFRSLCYTIS